MCSLWESTLLWVIWMSFMTAVIFIGNYFCFFPCDFHKVEALPLWSFPFPFLFSFEFPFTFTFAFSSSFPSPSPLPFPPPSPSPSPSPAHSYLAVLSLPTHGVWIVDYKGSIIHSPVDSIGFLNFLIFF